jgi:hypothetical protein
MQLQCDSSQNAQASHLATPNKKHTTSNIALLHTPVHKAWQTHFDLYNHHHHHRHHHHHHQIGKRSFPELAVDVETQFKIHIFLCL